MKSYKGILRQILSASMKMLFSNLCKLSTTITTLILYKISNRIVRTHLHTKSNATVGHYHVCFGSTAAIEGVFSQFTRSKGRYWPEVNNERNRANDRF